MQALEKTPGALDHFAQITYHLYGNRDSIPMRQAIRDWSKRLNVTCAQTEWLQLADMAVVNEVWKCITIAGVVSWERYGWGSWYKMDFKNWTYEKGSTGSCLWQFSHHIRPGYVRVESKSADDLIRPVAFVSPAKKVVLVVLNNDSRPRKVLLSGLPADAYVATRTAKDLKEFCKGLGEMKADADQPLVVELPAQSVTTLTSSRE
jgi:O-glycosyl hydrolase